MSNYFTIKPDDPLWDKYVKSSNQYDFYHTASYHSLEEHSEPILFVYQCEKDFVAVPLLIRQIDNTNLYDCTSVYGYCGPLTNIKSDSSDPKITAEFNDSLLDYFKSKNIVSAFSRLHPIINNDKYLDAIGSISDLNKTIAIDLSLNLDESRKKYRKSNKSEINQLRRKGFTISQATTNDDIDEFISIYYETMKRVDANSMYYFDRSYFRRFLRASDFDSKLLLAKKDNIVAAGAIFTVSNNFMQYHLAGTREEYIKDTPMKLIIDEARIIGNSLSMKYLHLGGGVAGSDDDSLFRFKSGFSDLTFQFRIWKLIVNSELYEELVISKGIEDSSLNNYFPLYRLKK